MREPTMHACKSHGIPTAHAGPGAKDQERLAMQDSCTKNKVPNQCFHTMPPVPPDCCKLISRTVKLILRQDGGGRQHAHRDLQQSVTKCWYTGSQEPGTKDQEPWNKRQGPRAKDQDSAMHGPTAKYIIYICIYIWLVTGFQFCRFPGSKVPHAIPDFQAPGVSTFQIHRFCRTNSQIPT